MSLYYSKDYVTGADQIIFNAYSIIHVQKHCIRDVSRIHQVYIFFPDIDRSHYERISENTKPFDSLNYACTSIGLQLEENLVASFFSRRP